MTINIEQSESIFGPDAQVRRSLVGKIDTVRFTEQSSPELTLEARRLQAVSYLDRGFVTQDAIETDGTLKKGVDHGGGDYAQYYTSTELSEATTSDAALRKATLRKIYIPPAGGLDNLPAYVLCKDNMYDEERHFLETINNPHKYVQEIGALAQSKQRSQVASFGAMRQVLQDSFGKEQVWVFSIVDSTYAALVRSFGPAAIRRAGDLVGLGGEGVSEEVKLVPVILEVDNFLQNIYDSALQEDTPQKFRRQFGSLVFFSEGMPESKLPNAVAVALAPIATNNITRQDSYTA